MTVVLPDTSVWARRHRAEVAGPLADAIEANAVALIEPIVLELLTSARSASDLARLAHAYGGVRRITLNRRVMRRAREIQAGLARRGQHRGPSVVDLLAAAAGELAGAEVWHCDRHFEQIAALTGQPVRRLCD